MPEAMCLWSLPTRRAGTTCRPCWAAGAAKCQCQRIKLGGHDWFAIPVEGRAHRLRGETDCGHPEVDRTSGMLALTAVWHGTVRLMYADQAVSHSMSSGTFRSPKCSSAADRGMLFAFDLEREAIFLVAGARRPRPYGGRTPCNGRLQ